MTLVSFIPTSSSTLVISGVALILNDDAPENFNVVCTVKADTSSVKPQVLYSEKTKVRYYKVDYDIVLLLGLTELKAQIAYLENVR